MAEQDISWVLCSMEYIRANSNPVIVFFWFDPALLATLYRLAILGTQRLRGHICGVQIQPFLYFIFFVTCLSNCRNSDAHSLFSDLTQKISSNLTFWWCQVRFGDFLNYRIQEYLVRETHLCEYLQFETYPKKHYDFRNKYWAQGIKKVSLITRSMEMN